MKKFASTVVLTLAAAVGAASAVVQPAVAEGALPGMPGVTGISARAVATRALPLVRASAPGERHASVVPGAQLWVRRYDGPGNSLGSDDAARSVAVSPGGGTVFVTGYSQGTTSDEYATVAYDAATSAQLWVSRYDGPASLGAEANSVAVSPGGGAVFVTGSSDGGSNGEDYATVAYNA
ncbi:MAG TPA: hypothetical protein VK131_13300, partial [Candidatus Acidoferrales bacterium]|nr:hypothetical protein [Candidatus Acidoferrales bacterium]